MIDRLKDEYLRSARIHLLCLLFWSRPLPEGFVDKVMVHPFQSRPFPEGFADIAVVHGYLPYAIAIATATAIAAAAAVSKRNT